MFTGLPPNQCAPPVAVDLRQRGEPALWPAAVVAPAQRGMTSAPVSSIALGGREEA